MRLLTGCTTVLLTAALAGAVSAEDVPMTAREGAAPEVGLDQLLRLPNSYEADVDRRSGANESQWRTRFAEARQELADARKRLAEIEQELQNASQASSGWAVAAPGSTDPEASPLSLRLRQEVREQRDRIAEAERRLRQLDVEADLAAVPPEWRE